MSISDKTVRNHISDVTSKLGVKGRTQAVVELLRLEELMLEQAGRGNVLFFLHDIRVQRTSEGIQDAMFEMQGYEAAVWERKSIRV